MQFISIKKPLKKMYLIILCVFIPGKWLNRIVWLKPQGHYRTHKEGLMPNAGKKFVLFWTNKIHFLCKKK